MQKIKKLADEFNKFVKDNFVRLIELEQANFISSCKGLVNLENIVNNMISNDLHALYKSVIFSDFDFYIEKIQQSHFSFIDKKHMMLLLIATRSEKYAQTLAANINENERKFLNSYLKKTKEFVDFCVNDKNTNELALFLYDLNAFRKYLKKDDFIMPIKLSNAFNWAKKEIINPKDKLEKTKNILFKSRRRFYNKLNLHKDLIRDYESFDTKINNLLKEY